MQATTPVAATARPTLCAVREEEPGPVLSGYPSRQSAQPCHPNRYAIVGGRGCFRVLEPGAFQPGLSSEIWPCAKNGSGRGKSTIRIPRLADAPKEAIERALVARRLCRY